MFETRVRLDGRTEMIAENIQRAVKDLYEYDGCKNIRVIRELNTYVYLVRFDQKKQKFSSIVLMSYETNTAEEICCEFRSKEQEMEEKWLDEYAQQCQQNSDSGAGEAEEYEIQSDIDTSLSGYSYDLDHLDNTDYGRWFDDHEGEVWEH